METLLEKAAVTHPDVLLLGWELPGKQQVNRIVVIRSAALGTQIMEISARPNSVSIANKAEAFVNRTDPPEKNLAVFKERQVICFS